MKPTISRITYIKEDSYFHSRNFHSGFANLQIILGPITKSVNDITLFMKSLLYKNSPIFKEDPTVYPLVFNEEEISSKRKLRIGYILDSEFFQASSSQIRAVRTAKNVLEKNGHKLISLKYFFKEEKLFHCFLNQVSGSNFLVYFKETIKNEEKTKIYDLIVAFCYVPKFLKKILSYFLNIFGEKRKAELLNSSNSMKAYEFYEVIKTNQILR